LSRLGGPKKELSFNGKHDHTLPAHWKEKVEYVTIPARTTINVSGADLGQAQANARAVARAMQDPIRQVIATLKQAQNHEARLGYV
jgi:hypothetical protein